MNNQHIPHKHTETNFGKRIKQIREEKSIALREAARKTGLSSGYLSLLENGKQVGLPSENTIRQIAIVLDVEADELILLADRLPDDELQAIRIARQTGLISKADILAFCSKSF